MSVKSVVDAADHARSCLFDDITGGINFESICCYFVDAIADCKGPVLQANQHAN